MEVVNWVIFWLNGSLSSLIRLLLTEIGPTSFSIEIHWLNRIYFDRKRAKFC